MHGEILQKKAVDDEKVEWLNTVDTVTNTNGVVVLLRKKMMSVIYIAYPEGCSVITRERVGW
jgi:hypothetical protein